MWFFTSNSTTPCPSPEAREPLLPPLQSNWWSPTYLCDRLGTSWKVLPWDIITSYVLLGASIGASSVHARNFLRRRYPGQWDRIKTQDWVTPGMYNKTWIKGYVTAVGDSDNFRLFHTPGFGWRLASGPKPKRKEIPQNARGHTISIRLAGIDAPEGGHFPVQVKQKYYKESTKWLTDQILYKTVYCKIMRKDQYGRVIALVYSKPIWSRSTENISLKMLQEGWAHVYKQSGAVYGSDDTPSSELEDYLKAQAQAKSERKGIWKNPREEQEHPSEYKRRYAASIGIPEAAIPVTPDTPKSTRKNRKKVASRTKARR
ncbi:hypothetical protein BDY19DRAFT_952630 [Irpex rosettiformis]|uniref:Uncharacterized protein n=1 Tax=Irpex rosettiformis TaxID=378272 RepID=A0ACB8U0K0_9APHY|nr:hypothetical protein BDY19DRAFT_952630 [Irpex rosettiformis]